jgi:hypothetical protein
MVDMGVVMEGTPFTLLGNDGIIWDSCGKT